MKVNDLISTFALRSERGKVTLYVNIRKEGSGVEYVFTTLDIDEVKSEVPFVLEREVSEWSFAEQDCPFNHLELDSDTLYIITK